MKAEQTQQLLKKKPADGYSTKDDLTLAEQRVKKVREDLKQFSQAATSVLNNDEEATKCFAGYCSKWATQSTEF
jgi:hypothetical protein